MALAAAGRAHCRQGIYSHHLRGLVQPVLGAPIVLVLGMAGPAAAPAFLKLPTLRLEEVRRQHNVMYKENTKGPVHFQPELVV